MSYRDYFDIDPEYFPQVDKKIIDTQPELWKKFYPHPSFVELLKTTVDVLKRKQKLSIWVDGAYGTGKSHAVLTLKKLIEANDDDTLAYFEKYGLDDFLCKDLTSLKNEGKILVCHRYGSSDIEGDNDLIVAMQEGIETALLNAGIDNTANESVKKALIRFFQNTENKLSFNIYATGTYKDIMGGDTADSVLEKLESYKEDALLELIEKLFKVPAVKGAFSMNTGELCEWIREIIDKNNLKELVFIWDEFSEYFENNMHHLTGFQQIAELAATAPFCLMIVTHKAEGYFSDSDPDKRKILDRFVPPIHVSLPENIAFELMAQAMKVTDDTDLAAKWQKNRASLDRRTMQSREAVKNKIQLSDNDLTNVLPIHPYAALLLQHISIYYTSTARSMFNFIKNDEGDDVKAFQWFIDNYDFTSINPFVTIDMLWSFFYEKGQDKLASGIKEVLGCYTSRLEKSLMEQEKRVLKTILLLQAVSDRMSGNRDIFLPNTRNLSLAFEGTDLENAAPKIAGKLLNDHVITRTPLTGEEFSYCCKNIGPSVDPTPFISEAKAKSTKDLTLMTDSELRTTIELSGALKLRYSLAYSTASDFDSEVKKANNPSSDSNKLYAVSTIAKDSIEGAAIKKKISAFFEQNPDSQVVIIDSSDIEMGEAAYNEFIENYAMALAIGQSDITQRKTYEQYAIDTLKEWSKRIKTGAFYVYYKKSPDGFRCSNNSDLMAKLLEIDRFYYPECLEGEFTSVLNTMFDANSLGAGANCGILEETKGTFRSSNDATKLEKALEMAWKIPDYWKSSHSYIAGLKNALEEYMNEQFKKTDRIAISSIYGFFKQEPYGFMPCNLTAFIMGFLLKEYANEAYSYSDNLSTVPMSPDGLASMISEMIKQDNTPDKRYKDKYIVTLTKEEREFNRVTSVSFGIPEKYCVSLTETRSRIREQMKSFSFPIWVIKYAIDNEHFDTSKDVVCSLIDKYCGIANNHNLDEVKSDNDIAQEIGALCIQYPSAADDLQKVLSKEKCKEGMLEYLKVYSGGELPLIAKEINDGGQYINHLAYKFNSDAANWVWNVDTANSKIDELITEYKIIVISNKILTKNTTFLETITAWINKTDQIKIAFSVMKNELGEEKQLFEILYNLKKANAILESQKETFLNALNSFHSHFRNFMASQNVIFSKVCAFYLDELTDDDVKALLENDEYGFSGSFIEEPNSYMEKVQLAVKEYKNTLGHIRLKKHWKELTGTESPYDWSNEHIMPILAMVPETDSILARKVFDTINNSVTDELRITEAEEFIEKKPFVKELKDKEVIDRAFKEAFLSEYAVLFDNLGDVKKDLREHISEEPFYWLGSKAVMSRISTIAKAKYFDSGYGEAQKIIDEMPSDQVKEYLKKLIQDNIIVGVEIIKGNKDK